MRIPFIWSILLEDYQEPAMSTPEDLNEIYVHELKDLWSANDQMMKALKKMTAKASDGDLKDILTKSHEDITKHTDVLKELIADQDERVNGSLRDELLNGEIFCSLAEAKVLIEAWRRHYNTVRSHSSLGYRPPAPEAATPPLPASGSASLQLQPAMAEETTMH